jgi:anaerobic selenocysteine-containing dehydrogenase
VRPGTDAALALAITHVMLERGWFDEPFVRQWTNGPLLVRSDNGRLLREQDLSQSGDPANHVAWNQEGVGPAIYDPRRGSYDCKPAQLALFGEMEVATPDGKVTCRPALQLAADACRRYTPDAAEAITGVAAGSIERVAQMLWESRPVALYFWSGIEQHTNTSQIARAICQLYALTGSVDALGGNVAFPAVPSNGIFGPELLPAAQAAKALGAQARPIGPARWQLVTSHELYTAALEAQPYRVRGLVGFGANLLLASGDSARGRTALSALDFYVHADLFMNPTAELADIVLPVATPFETEGLQVGFETSVDAQSLVQLRAPVVPTRGETRSDLQIIFELAKRLGLGKHFWDGDIDAAYRYRLEPSGVSLDQLRAQPGGVRVPLEPRYQKYAEVRDDVSCGFHTASRKIELYSELLLDHGYPPLPEFEEPLMSPQSRPDLAARYPLILTCAKTSSYCESQHRQLPSLRKRAPDPEVELHPDTAAARGITAGDWVRIETPAGSVRARAALNDSLAPGIVCGQNGWWQACDEIGAPGYDPFSPDGANFNLVVRLEPADPMSGSVPLRSYICDVSRID